MGLLVTVSPAWDSISLKFLAETVEKMATATIFSVITRFNQRVKTHSIFVHLHVIPVYPHRLVPTGTETACREMQIVKHSREWSYRCVSVQQAFSDLARGRKFIMSLSRARKNAHLK